MGSLVRVLPWRRKFGKRWLCPEFGVTGDFKTDSDMRIVFFIARNHPSFASFTISLIPFLVTNPFPHLPSSSLIMNASAFPLFAGLVFIMMLMAKTVLAQDETITIASAQFVVDPSEYILDSTTIAPGSAGVSIDGQVVSADPANDLFVNGVEVLTGHRVASVSTTASSPSTMSVMSNRTSGSASSGSQYYGTVLVPATASLSGHFPSSRSSSPDRDTLVPGNSTGTGLSVSNFATSVASSTDSFTHGSAISASDSSDSIVYTSTATLSSRAALNQSAVTVSTSSASSLAPGPNANTNSGSSAPLSAQDAAASLSSTGSNPVVQSSDSTGSSASATFLASNGTSSGLSSASTQIPSVYSTSATVPKALGSSGTTSSATLGSSNGGSTIPGSITSGPAIAMPVTTINPTGAVASAAGVSLGALIFDISQEAQTLSSIVTNSASSSSYVLKIETVELKWNDYFKKIGGDNPPTYDTACTGGGLTGLLKLAGCIIGGLNKISTGIKGIDIDNPGPQLTEIEGVIDNVAEMIEEEEKEEEDDDDEQSTQNESQASMTQQSSEIPSVSVSSTVISSAVISSSVSRSASSSALSSGILTDPPCDTVVPQAQPAGYSINNGASEVVLGFVGDILLSVLGGEISGFTTSTIANSTSAMISSTAIIPSTMSSAVSSEGTTSASTPAKTRTSSWSSVATSSIPVIIPGQGGLSPCVEYLSNDQGYAPGTENYCFCDGIKAPMLSRTVSGTILSDCSYTTMPTSNWTPTVTAGYSSSTPPPSIPPSLTPTPQFNPALATLLNPLGGPQLYECTMMYVPSFSAERKSTVRQRRSMS